MSETEQEPQETAPEPDEGQTVEQGEPDSSPSEGTDGEPGSPDTEPEPIEGDDADVTGPTTLPDEIREQAGDAEPTEPGVAEAQYLSEKEIEKRLTAIGKENDRHTKRLSEIMAEDATDLVPCPLCSGFAAGWIFPPQVAPIPGEVSTATLALLGFEGPHEYQRASDTETCPECAGEGFVDTGSKREGYKHRDCGRCGSTGYILTGQLHASNGAEEHATTATGPTIYADDVSSDPDVQRLRERGFTVFPPVQVATG